MFVCKYNLLRAHSSCFINPKQGGTLLRQDYWSHLRSFLSTQEPTASTVPIPQARPKSTATKRHQPPRGTTPSRRMCCEPCACAHWLFRESPRLMPRPDCEKRAQREENLCACALQGPGEWSGAFWGGWSETRGQAGETQPASRHQELS